MFLEKITLDGVLKAITSRLTTSKTVNTPGLYAADAAVIKDLQNQLDSITIPINPSTEPTADGSIWVVTE